MHNAPLKSPPLRIPLSATSSMQTFVLVLSVFWSAFSTVAAVELPVKIGVLAKRGNQQCLAQWSTTAQYLTDEIPNHSFEILPLGFDEIQSAVDRREVDFVLANSSFYVDLEVRSGAQTIATLKNKKFMAVDQRSLGGWHMGWFLLKENGIDPLNDFKDLRFGGSHDAVVYAVREGIVDAGTVRSDTIERMALERKIRIHDFKVINQHSDKHSGVSFVHSTRHYPEWPMARFPHTSDYLTRQVAIALLQMPAQSPAAMAANCAGWTTPQNYRPVHECLMALRLSPYQDYGKFTLGGVLRQYRLWLLGTLALSLLMAFSFVRSSRLKAKLEQSVIARKERERDRTLLQTVLDSMPSGVMIVDAETRRVREVNPTAAKMIGLKAEDIVGNECHRYIFQEKDYHCPILDKGQLIDSTEHVLLTAASGEIPILKTVVPLMLEGRGHLLESFFDIRERKLAEAERERLVLAIEQVKENVLIADVDGTIQFVNRAFEDTTGFCAEDVLGKNVRILKSGQHDDSFYQEMGESLLKGETWVGRLVNEKKDGTLFTEEGTISPVLDSSGNIVNFVAVKHDITDEIKREEHFRQAQKMESVGRLAGGMAHDFNNMLGVILGYADMALDDVAPTSPLHDDLKEIKIAAERSADLTRQLLAFARKQTIAPEVLNLNQTLSDMLNMLKRLTGEGIDLEWQPEAEIWSVKVDPSLVNQILVNLCLNAKDAINGVGKIVIQTKNITFDETNTAEHEENPPGQFVQLAVSDDGCGIQKEVLNKIYEPFFTTKTQGRGTGLGLATVYGSVKQNKGFINVYSEEGVGTTFRIYFPRAGHTIKQSGTTVLTDVPTRGQETILLVEDEPAILKLTAAMLENLGYTLLKASTPSQAIRLVEEATDPIHLLLTDVVMPQMNGRDLAEKLLVKLPTIKPLFMSGYPSNVIAHHGVLDEGVHFIGKPFALNELALKVRYVLDKD